MSGLDMPGWYILGEDKKPIPCSNLDKQAQWQRDNKHLKRVAETTLGPAWISTVFLGLDHGFGGALLIFETMVFWSENESMHNECERYSTWEQAEIGHVLMVERVRVALETEKAAE